MKLFDTLLLFLGAALVIIGVHQILTNGFGSSYWIIMLAFILFFVYTLRKKK